MNKILLVLCIILCLVLAGLIVWQKFGTNKPTYWAIYLKSGDLYFGKLIQFPSFGLKNVYTLQVNQQNAENPVSVQKFTNVFWGPEDFLKINRAEVTWMTKLKSDGQLAQLLKTNPSLQANPTQTPPPQIPPNNTKTEEKNSDADKNSENSGE